MKTYKGSRDIAPVIPNVANRCRWVENFTLWPL